MTLPSTLLVTGATGQLGRLVIDELLKTVAASTVTALVRDGSAASSLAERGVRTVFGDYTKPETLDAAFSGIDRVLLISSNDVGKRLSQHKNVIDAAKRAGVQLLAYTSILHASSSPLGLADEHRGTEAALRASGVPFVLLRNGWYHENYTGSVATAVANGGFSGSAGDGRIASAARADYAAAAAAVLTAAQAPAGRIYELAGDEAYTLTQFAQEIARQTGKPVSYHNLAQSDFEAALLSAGLPDWLAAMLADSSTGASKGGLFDDAHELRGLIGRATTPISAAIAKALQR